MKLPRAVLALVTLSVACGNEAPPVETETVQNRGEGKEQWWDALPRPAWERFERIDIGASDQGWFEVYAVRPGIFAIYEPGQFEEAISYLVVGTERALLLDTGLGIGDIRAVTAALTDLEPIVVNSHTHYDHIGGNHAFTTVFGTRTSFTEANARGKKHEEVAEFVGDGWIWKETPPGFSRDGYAIRRFTITETLKDGDVLDLGDRLLEVLLTPGHAPDALCLLDRENRLLFTGDTFYPAVLYAHLPGSDLATYRATAARLRALVSEVDELVTSHNEPLASSQYLVRMSDAFDAIVSGSADFASTDGDREYFFDGFSVLTPEPLPLP